jgi:hypothetical protein
MRFLMTDAGHAGVPYHLIPPYFGIDSYKGSTKIDRKIGEELDGLECFLPATLMFSSVKVPDKYGEYLKLSESFVEEFGNMFRFYAFHACFEDPAPVLANTNFNLAESSYDDGVKFLKFQSRIASNIANAPCSTSPTDYKRIAPLVNVHMGRVRDFGSKDSCIDNVVEILKKAAYDTSLVANLCVENLDPGKNGFYNIGECNDDIARVLDSVPNVFLTYDLSHVDAVAFNDHNKKGRSMPDSESEIAGIFLDYHNKFMNKFEDRIVHMHLSFNDIFFSQNPIGYYALGRHCPLTKAKKHELFYDKAFKPVVKRALNIVENNRKGFGCVNLEIPRKRMFGVKIADCGGSISEQVESIAIAKEIYKGH